MKKKGLVLIMTIIFALSLFCVTASMTVFAAGQISDFNVLNLRSPLAGNTPDYNVEFTRSNLSLKDMSEYGTTNGIIWYRMDSGSTNQSIVLRRMNKDDTFELNKSYMARIYVTPNYPYVFADNIAVSVYELSDDTEGMEGKTGYVSTPPGDNESVRVIECTYKCTKNAIREVQITGLKLPELGEHPDDDCNVLTEGVFVNNAGGKVQWFYDLRAMNPSTDTFEAGKTYKLSLWLKTDFLNGYWFKTDSNGENIAQVYINGIPFEVCDTYEYDHVRGVEFEFYVPYNIVEKVAVVGVDAPVAGKVPDYDVAPTSSGYAVTEVVWIDKTTGETLKEGDGKTFIAQHDYTVGIEAETEDTYVYKDDGDVLTVDTFINGNATSHSSAYAGEKSIYFVYNFGTPELQTVKEINIKDVDAPVTGNLPDYDVTVLTEGVEIKELYWYDETAGERLDNGSGKKFVAGHIYKICFTAVVGSSYKFRDDGDVLTVDAFINGEEATFNSAYAGERELSFSLGFDKTLYRAANKVVADGFDLPVAGNIVDIIGSVEGTGTELKEIYWFDTTDSVKLEQGAAFKRGHIYKLVITVGALADYRFAVNDQGYPDAANLNVSINGETADVEASGSGDTLTFSYTFEHTCAYNLVKAVTPTCVSQGKNAYYKCSCNKLSETADGSKPIADIDIWGIIPVDENNHSWTNACDTSCNRTGCTATRTITHSYNAATCTKAKTCKVCGATSGSKLGHTYDNACDTTCNRCSATRTITHSYNAAICTKAKTCKVCGATSGSKLGHTYDNACDTTCNRCSATRTITHSYNAATCTKAKTCKVCGATSGSKLGHTYDNACDTTCNRCSATRTITHSYNAATCTKAKTCKVCGATSGSKLGHTYDNACDTTCNRCSATRTITHSYNAATCTKAKTCKVCGATSGKALGHKYSNACDTSCNTCKATRKITHSYKSTTTKATLTKNGKVVNKCTICGNVKSTTTVYYPKTIKLSDTKYTYNGKAKKPSVTVKDSKGKALKKDTDYTVKYASGRKSTGKYTVTVTFKGKYSGTKKLTFNILPSKTSKITPACTTTSIKASWKKVTGADGYKVELLNSKGKVVKTATTTKTAYTFKKLSKVTTYKVKVTAYKTIDKKKVYSTVSTTITTSTAPAKVTLSKVTAGKKQATPAWKTVNSVSGYEVMYSTSSKFKSSKTATVKKGSSKKTTIKKLTKGKKYYFKVRAYKTVDGKNVYGAWSAVKNVKIK